MTKADAFVWGFIVTFLAVYGGVWKLTNWLTDRRLAANRRIPRRWDCRD